MKTFFAILGALFLLFLVWYFGFKKGFTLNLLTQTANPGNNSSNCDPLKSGYDKDGFPSIDCGFGARQIGICSDCSQEWQKQNCDNCKSGARVAKRIWNFYRVKSSTTNSGYSWLTGNTNPVGFSIGQKVNINVQQNGSSTSTSYQATIINISYNQVLVNIFPTTYGGAIGTMTSI